MSSDKTALEEDKDEIPTVVVSPAHNGESTPQTDETETLSDENLSNTKGNLPETSEESEKTFSYEPEIRDSSTKNAQETSEASEESKKTFSYEPEIRDSSTKNAQETSKSTIATKSDEEDADKPRFLEVDPMNLSRRKKRKSSEKEKQVVFVLDKKAEVKQPEVRRSPKKRPSYVRKKIIALEKQLDSVSKSDTETRVFSPESIRLKSDSSGEQKNIKDAKPQRTYISPTMACFFIIAINTGATLQSIPYYLKESSWLGVFLVYLLGLNAMYGGFCIGWCWIIVEEKWPEHEEYTRIPYQHIAHRAIGICMKYFVALSIDVSVLGTCAIFIILLADSVENVVYPNLDFCFLLIIVTFVVMPFTLFGSYRDIKLIGILDAVCSALHVFFVIISFFMHKPSYGPSKYSSPTFNRLITAFAGFSLAYGSGPPMANILLDMADRKMFTHSCATAFMVTLSLYVLIAIMGYAAYGDDTPEYVLRMILQSRTTREIGVFINIIYILQLMTTLVTYLLPFSLAMEERVRCPDRFGLGRLVLRVAILSSMLLFVLGLPYMSMYFELVGATTLNLTTFIFPPIFYVCLVYQARDKSKWYISKKEWILIIETVLLGIIVAAVTTVTKFQEVTETSNNEHRTSCYLNMTAQIPSFKQWITITPGL